MLVGNTIIIITMLTIATIIIIISTLFRHKSGKKKTKLPELESLGGGG